MNPLKKKEHKIRTHSPPKKKNEWQIAYEKCLISLDTRYMKIKTRIRYTYIPIKMFTC